jgi:NADPH-dependent 2,4-dienoyl-CoA reductase/sulfur reductase-like enzyme
MSHETTAPTKPRRPGRPAKANPHEAYVSVPLPTWVVEHLDTLPDPRGRTVARLFLERLAATTYDVELARKLNEVLYG